MLGMYHALIEARIPFELVHEAFLTPDRIDRFKLLILADRAALSDAQCAAIRSYVEPRRQRARHVRHFALRRARTAAAGLRPRRPVRRVVRRARSRARCRTRISPSRRDPQTGRRHPVLDGMEDTSRIINGVFRVAVRPAQSFPSPLTLIPDVSRPADGGRLSARSAHRHARAVPARHRRQPGRLHSLGHRPHVLGRDVRRSRPAAAERRRGGRRTNRSPSTSRGPACSTSRFGASATR